MIRLANAVRTFDSEAGTVHALRGVSLAVGFGQFVALLGPSGSGKSTLLNVLGLLDRLSGGSYSLAGRDTMALSPLDRAVVRRSSIGFVFQSYFLLPHRSIEENVELGALYSGDPNRQRAAIEAIEAVGMRHRLGFRPRTLSGGEQQRIAIARAVVNRPALLLADEPTGNLDAGTGEKIMGLLRRVNEAGTAVVVVTHDRDVARSADTVYEMRDGRLGRADV